MLKKIVVELPVTIDVNSQEKTCLITYNKEVPVLFEDGTRVVLQFNSPPAVTL